MFLHLYTILSAVGGGVCPSAYWNTQPPGRHPTPWADNPPPQQTPLLAQTVPLGRHLPWAITPTGQTSPLGRHPPYPCQQTATQHQIQWPGRGGPRNMKSMWPPLAAIFLMTYFYRAWGAMPPSAPPLDPLLLLQRAVCILLECILFVIVTHKCH